MTLRGLAGVALGVIELAAPGKVVRMDGMRGDAAPWVRLAGAHKLTTGLGMLTGRDSRAWLRLALAGAAYDGAALAAQRAKPDAFVRLAALAGLDALLLRQAARG